MTTRLLKSSENINGLPTGFQEVEYLESTGTQYIDTGYTPKPTSTYKSTFQLTNITTTSGNWFCVFGSVESNNSTFTELFLPRASGGGDVNQILAGNHNSSYIRVNYPWAVNAKYSFEMTPTAVSVNGVSQGSISVDSSFTCSHSIYLFARHEHNDTVGYNVSAKIHSFTIYEGNTLVRDFIPALNPAGRPCMYDLVGKKAYYNLGTGEFSYGRKIIPVEYLESTGTQYIDTGYIPQQNIKIETDFQLTEIPSGTFATLCGSLPASQGYSGLFVALNYTVPIQARTGLNTNPNVISTYSVNTDRYKLSVEFNKLTINGDVFTPTTLNTWYNTNNSLYFFSCSGYDQARRRISAKMWYFKVYAGEALVRDYVPCIDENNTPYMFDKVTHTVYDNAGTGTFNYGKKLYSSKVRLYKDSGARFGEVLPKGFKRVEYLENTGVTSARNWISTGIVPDTTTRWEVRLSFNNTSTGKLMGSGYATPTRFNIGIESSKFRFAFNGWFDANPDITTPDTNPHTWIMDAPSKTFTIDEYSTTTTQTFGTSTFPIALFGRCNSGNGNTETSNAVIGKIYYSKIWQNDVLVSDMIPVLDNNGIPCMYDKVSGELFYNRGTGQFTYGAIIPNKVRLPQSTEIRFPKGYTEVEYLESDSTAYIDTGVSGANNNLKIEMGFSYSKFTAYGYLFSNYESEQHNTTRFLLDSSNNSRALAYINTKSQDGAIYNSNCTKDNFHTFVLTKTSVSIDGNTTTNNNPPVGTANTKNIILFNRGAGTYYEKRDIGMRCYYFRIYDNDNLIRYFIPALDPNGKPCMWDVVTKQPFYNQGTGEFTYGRSIQQVGYLESSGGQYIDTKINPTDDYGYRIKNTYTVGQGEQCAIGCMDASNRFVGIYTSGSSNAISGAWGDYVGFLPSYPWTTDTILDVKCNYKNSRKMIIDDTEMKDISDVHITGTIGNSIYIGARHYDSNVTKMQGKIYGAEITNGTEIIADYVPAIDSNNVGFMFDRVTHTIFDNAGTGSFTYGSLVPNKIRD